MASQSDERLSRIKRLIGEEGVTILQQSFITVVGLGAVGSYAVEGLARAGIGHLLLIDFDEVQPSNINRQLFALESTIGKPKTEVAIQRVQDINTDCNAESRHLFVNRESVEEALNPRPHLLIDAIDSLNPKLALLDQASRLEIPTISSMGAALRTDPTKLRTGLLSETSVCPLARLVRKQLRRRDSSANPYCVWSEEHLEHLPGDAIAELDDSDPNILDCGRPRRTLGSLPTLTGIFGLTAANLAIQHLLRKT